MRLLIVGFAGSVHIARYTQLLADAGWEVHLFASDRGASHHPDLPALTLHPWKPGESSHARGLQIVDPACGEEADVRGRAAELRQLIAKLRPHVIHSHEIQHGGTLVHLARGSEDLPAPWLLTNWGSDIFWYRRDRRHARLIRAVLGACDYYSAECHRDVALARAFGLRGKVIGVWPVAGGVDLEIAASLRAPGPTSARRAIAVKGAVNAIGQGHTAVTVLERCAKLIEGFEVCGYQMNSDCEERLRALADAARFSYRRISVEPGRDATHYDLLRVHGRARVSFALNRSDGLSTSFVEALAMGSFPVQSSSSCGPELTRRGRGALFVPAMDPDAATEAMRRALTEDELVDEAAKLNAEVAAQHLDRRQIKTRTIDAYERIVVDAAIDVC